MKSLAYPIGGNAPIFRDKPGFRKQAASGGPENEIAGTGAIGRKFLTRPSNLDS